MLEWFSCRGMFLLSLLLYFLCFLSVLLSCINGYYLQPSHFTATSALHFVFWILFLVFVKHTGKCNSAFCVISSVNGVAAALSAGLVHGRPPEFAAGTHHYVFLGGSRIP